MMLAPCTSFPAIVFCLHSFHSFIRHPGGLIFLRHFRVRLRNVSLYGVSYLITYAYSKHLLETFFAGCLVPTITRPTRITSESATLISLLPSISKILEKVVHKNVYTFLEKNKVLYASQYGFRKNGSTVNAITELVCHTTNAIENR